jgi:hypothetical protein
MRPLKAVSTVVLIERFYFNNEIHFISIFLPATPSAPSNIRVTRIMSDSVTLGWDAPEDDGGMPLTGYVIERSTAHGWTMVGTTDASSRTYKVITGSYTRCVARFL